MTGFVIAIGLSVLFVIGAIVAMRPSPRQQQLSRLRYRALMAGLRVQLVPGTDRVRGPRLVEYRLPWRSDDHGAGARLELRAERGSTGDWSIHAGNGVAGEPIQAMLRRLPARISAVIVDNSGIAARWEEQGSESDVDILGNVLFDLRKHCAGVAV